jgi:hypothetical protein
VNQPDPQPCPTCHADPRPDVGDIRPTLPTWTDIVGLQRQELRALADRVGRLERERAA